MFQSLAQLENLCKQLYETTDTATRLQAEKALVEFTNSPDCLSKCQLLLERGSVCKPIEPSRMYLKFSQVETITLAVGFLRLEEPLPSPWALGRKWGVHRG